MRAFLCVYGVFVFLGTYRDLFYLLYHSDVAYRREKRGLAAGF